MTCLVVIKGDIKGKEAKPSTKHSRESQNKQRGSGKTQTLDYSRNKTSINLSRSFFWRANNTPSSAKSDIAEQNSSFL